MAAGWSPIDALNKNSMAAAEDRPKARFRTRDISIKKMYSNEKNFYSMQDIEGLAQKILAAGLMENMTVAYEPCDRGIYKIIAGERRWRALNKLVEDGYKEFEIVTCQIKNAAEENEEIVQIIIANSYRDKSIEEMLEEEKQLKKALQYMRDNGLELQGYDLNKGRLRDVIASIMQKSTGKIAQIEKINSNLIPELQKEVREGRLNFSVAHEVSGLSQEKQHELLEKYEKGGLSVKEAKQAKEEEKEEDTEKPEESQEEWKQPEEENQEREWEDAHPESITSLCYSCQRYQECNVKTGTCQKCDQYVNKAEAEKTEELEDYEPGHSDDECEIEAAMIQVNVWSEKDQQPLVKEIKKLMKESGFAFVAGNDQAEPDTGIFTNAMRFLILKEAEEEMEE